MPGLQMSDSETVVPATTKPKRDKTKKNKDATKSKSKKDKSIDLNGKDDSVEELVEVPKPAKNEKVKRKRKDSVNDSKTSDDDQAEPKSKKSKSNKSKTETSPEVKEESSEKSDDDKNEVVEYDPNSIEEFRISKVIRDRLKSKGFNKLFPIQAKTFDLVFEGGDLVARARTGQGKTLAFVLPIITRLEEIFPNINAKRPFGRPPSVLVLAPTRELAKQVSLDFEYFGNAIGATTLCVYGGMPFQSQESALIRGVDIVVGTPGRIKDLIAKGKLNFKKVIFRVLDEADEMLNMGFVDDVETILNSVEDAQKVQTLLFSATMPDWVQQISKKFLKPSKQIVDLVGSEKLKASANVKHYVLPCLWSQRSQIISDVIRCYGKNGRVIVFTETKKDASELVSEISSLSAAVIHGDISQDSREATLEGFRIGKFKVLVATDVAARGLDINEVELVVQTEPPRNEEVYIHRSGRTGRAGNYGVSVMLYTPKKQYMIRTIEENCGLKFEIISPPGGTDIATAASAAAIESIKKVNNNVIPYFREAAQSLLNEDIPAVDILSKALAKISGYSEIKQRSLISFQEGYTTLLFTADTQVRSTLYVIAYLRRILPDPMVSEVKKLLMTKDLMGAVFDVPTIIADDVVKASQPDNLTDITSHAKIEIINTLPPLVRQDLLEGDGDSRGRGGYGRGGWGGNSRGRGGSYRGRGNSRGRSRGGFRR